MNRLIINKSCQIVNETSFNSTDFGIGVAPASQKPVELILLFSEVIERFERSNSFEEILFKRSRLSRHSRSFYFV